MNSIVASIVVVFSLLAGTPGDVVVGGNRPVVVHVPHGYDPAVPMPLLIALHGYGSSGQEHEDYMRFQPVADSRGLLYAHPDGTIDCVGNHFWDAFRDWCDFTKSAVDDASYLRGLITEIQAVLSVDPKRIYFEGHSNGGFMSYRMACQHADVIAAIASLAGGAYVDPALCLPRSGVHVLEIHGTADQNAVYTGGTYANFTCLAHVCSARYPGAVASVEEWASHNGCGLTPEPGPRLDLDQVLPGAETVSTRYTRGCRDDGSAELWTIQGGAHEPNLKVGFAGSVVDWLLKHPKGIPTRAAPTLVPDSGPAPLEVACDGSGSSSVDGASITSYAWDFGDGASEAGGLAQHTYASPGRYIAFLTITTNTGQVDTSARPVTVLCPSGDVAPWTSADVGAPAYSGAARIAPTGSAEELVICAGGVGFSSKSDEFFFYHEEAGGDFLITAKIPMITVNQCKVGLMARESLDPGAPFAAVALESSTGPAPNRFRFRYRAELGAATRSVTGGTLTQPFTWIRLERRGHVFCGETSPDGSEWTTDFEQSIDAIPSPALVGLAAAANDTRPDLRFDAFQTVVSALKLTTLTSEAPFHRGDPNSSGDIDLSDAIAIFGFLFLGDPTSLSCRESADANNDATIDISDGIYLLSWLFLGGSGPAAPGPPGTPCGFDADPPGSPGDLGCESYDQCP